MEIVSTALKNATLADTRETKAIVEFIVDNTPFPVGTTVTVSDEAAISDKDSVIEGNRDTELIANFENSGFLLDGNYFLPETDGTYGWWSDEMSDEDGLFSSNPYLQIDMTSTEVDKLTVLWGQNEYPLEWKLIINDTTTLELTEDDDVINVDDDVTELKIEIVKWFEGHKRAKIQCVDLGITKIYTDEDIVDITITEQCDHMGIELPSNDCSITIDNIDRDFDILNPYLKLRDENIIEKITNEDELSGFLNRCLYSLERLMVNKTFSTTLGSQEIKEMWIRKSNSVVAFAMENVEEDYEGYITKKQFGFKNYKPS
jgi:hypothetical protein